MRMPARILDGKRIAAEFLAGIGEQSRAVSARIGRRPHLAAVLVGDDSASRVYVRNKRQACERAEVQSSAIELPAATSLQELLSRIEVMNENPEIDGILVQLPLPK